MSSRRFTICFPFAGGPVGGSHVSAIKLIQRLDAREFEPLVVLHRGEGPVADLLRKERVLFEAAPVAPYFGVGGWARPDRSISVVPRLVRFLRDRQVAVVHTNEGAMHATWGLPARLAGCKLLWHHRSTPTARGVRFLAPLLAHRIVSVSRFAAPKSGLFSSADKFAVVYSPFDLRAAQVDRSEARRSLCAAENLPPSTRVLGYFGSLVGRKRPIAFVEAVAAILRREPSLPVVGLLFGEALEPGIEAATLARARELGVASHVRLMGFRYPPERWLAACDLLVVTAVDEPFGRTLIEAMLVGTPVVAARSGGNIEAIADGEDGLLADPDEPDAFAEAALRLLNDPQLWNSVARRARQRAMGRFGLDRHARAIEAIYRELLGAADAARPAARSASLAS